MLGCECIVYKQKTKKMDNTPTEDPRQQLLETLKGATNILVTVGRNPSVDQLAAMLGLTLALNKLGKHGTAVFSGEVPSTIEFLQPESTIEKTTDSLRDFIIALDKSKADKLRYKVEDDVVRIFITPYRTSISDADLEFSQGDFNVDVVVAIGVSKQDDLDEAIISHGRILHDATVTSVNVGNDGDLGSINLHVPQASSLSEIVVGVVQTLSTDIVDEQIATALLTGIVAETNRFSNEKTTPQTMSFSAALMSAGANQQLIATKLEEPASEPEQALLPETVHTPDDDQNDDSEDQTSDQPPADDPEPQKQDGELEIMHDAMPPEPGDESINQPIPDEPSDTPIQLPAEPEITSQDEQPAADQNFSTLSEGAQLMTEPPTLSGQLTANTEPEALDPSTDPMSQPYNDHQQLLDHNAPAAQAPSKTPEPFISGLTPPPPAWVPPSDDPFNTAGDIQDAPSSDETLTQIEADVSSSHVQPSVEPDAVHPVEGLDAARDEVLRALSDVPSAPEPAELPTLDLPAPQIDPVAQFDQSNLPLLSDPQPTNDQPPAGPSQPVDQQQSHEFSDVMADQIPTMPTPPIMPSDQPAQAPQVVDPNAPPPVPPPIPFQFGNPGNQ
jgi:hypothetical protein